jgi:hypothetical protein
MTKKALELIEGTVYQKTLEHKKFERKRLEKAGHENAATSVRASTAGYLQALCEAGIITERERQALFIYYATI